MLFAALRDFCLELGSDPQATDPVWWLAYSGGLDSHALLHLLANFRSLRPIKLRAVHVNHGLSPNAQIWARHCEKVCAALQVDFVPLMIDAKSSRGESPEEVARERRYAVFSELLAPGDLLFTAHHQDDQAETMLLQLFRGAGPKGLAAMPFKKNLGDGFQVRPLLNFTRADLQAYATENQLSWVEDESNSNKNFSRNFVRHEVMPILKNRWPGLPATLARVAEHCAEAQELLDEIAARDLEAARGSAQNRLSVRGLLALDVSRQRQVLRLWLRQQGCQVPGSVKIQQIQRDFLHARADRSPYMRWRDCELRRYRDDIFAMPCLRAHDRQQVLAWNLREPLSIKNLGTLRTLPTRGAGLSASLDAVTVGFRQGGEVCYLRGCTHSLKKLFQEYNVPPWERNRVPLVYTGGRLVAAVGYFVSEEFKAQANEMGYVLEKTTHDPSPAVFC